MTQPTHRADPLGSPEGNRRADILPFKGRGGESIDPNELSLAECVSFFIYRWNHPSYATRPVADIILADTTASKTTDELERRLQKAVDTSPLLDSYDEILEADPVTRLLDSLLRSTLTTSDSLLSERKAFRVLMFMRATEIIEQPDQELGPQLAHLPFGDEGDWRAIAERLSRNR